MNFRKIASRTVITLSLILLAPGAGSAPVAYRLGVNGLACPFCTYGIEKKLAAIRGVRRIEVDIASGTVMVTMSEGFTLDKAAAGKAVKEAGFSLRGFEPVQAASQSKQE